MNPEKQASIHQYSLIILVVVVVTVSDYMNDENIIDR